MICIKDLFEFLSILYFAVFFYLYVMENQFFKQKIKKYIECNKLFWNEAELNKDFCHCEGSLWSAWIFYNLEIILRESKLDMYVCITY